MTRMLEPDELLELSAVSVAVKRSIEWVQSRAESGYPVVTDFATGTRRVRVGDLRAWQELAERELHQTRAAARAEVAAAAREGKPSPASIMEHVERYR
jgi:hypothetical protein